VITEPESRSGLRKESTIFAETGAGPGFLNENRTWSWSRSENFSFCRSQIIIFIKFKFSLNGQLFDLIYLLYCLGLISRSLVQVVEGRDDHYPVCRLDIRQDSEFATGYGHPKTVFKREPDTDPDILNAFIDILRIQAFGKSCTLHNHSFIIFRSIFSGFCAMTPSLSVV